MPITLQFQTPQDLAAFRKVVKNCAQKVNVKELRLTCTCPQQNVALALNYYSAKVVGTEETR